MENDMLKHGVFALVSSIDLENTDVLPCYYDRQTIEQVFDNMKTTIDLIPLRCHKEESIAGHILISFLTSIGYLVLDKKFKKGGNSLSNSLPNLSRLHCRVYNSKLLIDTPNKKINDIAKILKIKIPNKISFIAE
jgi:transposase